ncbi:MAG: GGDEF domain-containing protein [Myxococcota bacterium]
MAQDEEETRVARTSQISDRDVLSESCLVVIYGDQLGRRHPLVGAEIAIGRGPENDIVIDMDNVSRRHARVLSKDESFEVMDLRSTNGTYVNDAEVDRHVFVHGDLLKIGGSILKFLQGGNIEALFHEEVYQMTIRDGLTGVHNKRYFLEFLDREHARCARYKRPLSLILFDLDRFKQVNDLHGHLAGDHVLKQLAELVGKRVRKEEAFARIGGEEFAVLLPETPEEKALVFAERIRTMVERSDFTFEGRSIDVTVSLGVGEIEPEMTAPQFVKAVDVRLYAAKDRGRNRVQGRM